jgi:hypothetical protein
MEQILRRADPTFASVPGLDPRRPPSQFRAADGSMVDLMTPMRSRADRNPMQLKGLGAGAVPLQYLDWLITDPLPSAVLHGAGVLVTVPDPVRYAVHKLILANVRAGSSGKRMKDLQQARNLMAAVGDWDHRMSDCIEDARKQGPKWSAAIAASLAEIERMGPVPMPRG